MKNTITDIMAVGWILFFLLSFIDKAHSQYFPTQKPVLCGEAEQLISELETVHKETDQQLLGTSEDATVVHLMFSSNKSYTILEIFTNGYACMIATGGIPEKKSENL